MKYFDEETVGEYLGGCRYRHAGNFEKLSMKSWGGSRL